MTFPSRLLSTPERLFVAFAGALLLVRIIALVIGAPNLGPDEGQYWFWAQSPDWGYYSKPPLVAWSIAATTLVFGEAEWAVRLTAPLYQTGAAIFIFLLCRRLAGARAAFFAGAAWLTMPGVFLSAQLITTDAPLLFFWSAALYFFFLTTDEKEATHRFRNAALLGAAIGFGFLSKYAMTFFALGAAAAIAVSPSRRRAGGLAPLFVAILTAVVIAAPNIWWNTQHDFQTISHTAANANWNGDFGHPGQLAEFLGAQFGVAGPILILLIGAAGFAALRGERGKSRETAAALLAFSAPAILIVSAQAFISRAHANWAAVAYPSAVILAAIFSVQGARAAGAMKASLVLHLLVGAGFLAAFSNFALADAVGADRAFRRLRGWDEIGRAVAAASGEYDAIMIDDREVAGELVYYARGAKPIVAWNSNRRIDNHFEAFHAYVPERDRRALLVTETPDAVYVQTRFRRIIPIGAISAPTGGGRARTLYLFDVSEPTAP